MKNIESRGVTSIERLLVAIDSAPWDALYRVAIGFVFLPVVSRLLGEDQSGWRLIPLFLGLLLALRVVPVVFRRALPFSHEAQSVWAQRRQWAKRYDSYQWQKLLWIGIGLTLYTLFPGQLSASRLVLCSFCLLSGGLGLARWRAASSRMDAGRASTKPVRDFSVTTG